IELQRWAAAQRRRAEEVARARIVATAADTGLERIAVSLAAADAERITAERNRAECDAAMSVVRERLRAAETELYALTDEVHRDEVARTEQRLRIAALEARATDELGVEPEALIAEYGPDVPIAPAAADGGNGRNGAAGEASSSPFVREEQLRRAAAAERSLARLGRFNPLALEEFAAMEERHNFLATQLEDLKATRRDLLAVVAEVDERVQQVFAAAFEDVAREFETVFPVLFPGGTGRLVLTDPTDLLTTGIEVEARPPGKKVQRLSLLSGGERSLTAIALLVSIFRARPSPFYVLDEVEAALDDRNLSRLVQLLTGLRSTSQLLIITHQKQTMEAADALYGVGMQGNGITTVISQRLRRDSEPVAV
ncbi:MAG: AAA family ATPase, partial [Actinomycetota bacterium]|nr:AAA family ATPase [Actinomycetota bacterium]